MTNVKPPMTEAQKQVEHKKAQAEAKAQKPPKRVVDFANFWTSLNIQSQAAYILTLVDQVNYLSTRLKEIDEKNKESRIIRPH